MVWSKLKTRLVSATIMVALLFLVSFGPALMFHIAVCIASLMVLREVLITSQQVKKPSLAIADYTFSLLFIICAFLPRPLGAQFIGGLLVFFIMTLLSLSVLKCETVKLSDVLASLFAVIYSVLLLIHLAFLRNMDNGLALVFLAFVGAWIPDTAAYFTGNFFGKRKLIEKVSPNKTVAGSIGAVVGSVIGFLIYGAILHAFGYLVNYFALVILAILCGVVAQLGDLAASVMKRTFGAKDFGNLIPGHGGLLDRVDSLIFIAPLVYYFVCVFPIIK